MMVILLTLPTLLLVMPFYYIGNTHRFVRKTGLNLQIIFISQTSCSTSATLKQPCKLSKINFPKTLQGANNHRTVWGALLHGRENFHGVREKQLLNEKTNVQRTTPLSRTLWHRNTTSGGFPTHYQHHNSVYWAYEDE